MVVSVPTSNAVQVLLGYSPHTHGLFASNCAVERVPTFKPRVLKTSLSNEQEAKLKAALSKVA